MGRSDSHAPRSGLPSIQPPPGSAYPIDLATALALANANNPLIALAREQTRQAVAWQRGAAALWLPSIRAGANYNKHEGAIQDVAGSVFNTSRGAFYAGSGAGVVGAGTPAVPGIVSQFHLADALYRPLAARQFARSRGAAARAAQHDIILNVCQGYLELLRAAQDVQVTEVACVNANRLAEITSSYARNGKGLQSDADRAAVELALRRIDASRAQEAAAVASARLAQWLRLDATLCLLPCEPGVSPFDLFPHDLPLCELVAQGLSFRPELVESRLLVSEAVQRLRREQAAPLVPSVLLGISYGAFGGGLGGNLTDTDGRFNADAMLFWELRNLGVGERSARGAAYSQVRQANLRQVALMDQVAREVIEAASQVRLRRMQIRTAESAVSFAAQSYHLNQKRIDHAQGLPIEALQSLQALVQSQREYLRVVTDYNVAQFTLQRALGWPAGR